MKRKQDGLVPIGEAFGGLDRPVQVIRKTPPPAQRAFTRFDQQDPRWRLDRTLHSNQGEGRPATCSFKTLRIFSSTKRDRELFARLLKGEFPWQLSLPMRSAQSVTS